MELNPKNCKKDTKKKNLLATYSNNPVESSSNVDDNIANTSMQEEVNLSSFHHIEEKEMRKIFHINIQVKKRKVDALYDFCSHPNLIEFDLFKNIGVEFHDHPSPYPLGWVDKDAYIKVME
jgi:hypothetical protein